MCAGAAGFICTPGNGTAVLKFRSRSLKSARFSVVLFPISRHDWTSLVWMSLNCRQPFQTYATFCPSADSSGRRRSSFKQRVAAAGCCNTEATQWSETVRASGASFHGDTISALFIGAPGTVARLTFGREKKNLLSLRCLQAVAFSVSAGGRLVCPFRRCSANSSSELFKYSAGRETNSELCFRRSSFICRNTGKMTNKVHVILHRKYKYSVVKY